VRHRVALRPEVAVLECLKHRYPKLSGSEVGGLLASLIEKLGDSEG